MIVARCLGQACEIRHFGQRQLIKRLVEIIEGGRRHAIGAPAEEDFVQIELEDAFFADRFLDANREQCLADLSLERHLVGEKEVLGDLLGDR